MYAILPQILSKFEFLPISWNSLAAIATFLVVLAALSEHRSFIRQEERKEKREVDEFVILPLKNRLSDLMDFSSERHFRSFEIPLDEIKENKLVLYITLKKELQQEIEAFHKHFKEFSNVSDKMQAILCKAVSDAFFELQSQEKRGFEFSKEGPPQAEELSNISLTSSLGGGAVTVYSLALRGITLNEYFSELKKRLNFPDDVPVDKIKVTVSGVHKYPSDLGRVYFEKLLQMVSKKFSQNNELLEYRAKWFDFYRKGMDLLEKLNKRLNAK